MAQHYIVAVSVLVIVSCLLAEVTSRPADNGSLKTQEYLPFYGGAKGQYLEVTKDNSGAVVKETIVSEDSISSENIVKNVDENLIAKVLAANLQKQLTLSTSLLKLHNIGRKTGSLGRSEKIQFKEQLTAIGETSSNLIKLIEEIGDDVDMLFRKRVAATKQYDDEVGEEGVGIDSGVGETSSELDLSQLGEVLSSSTIAEAKPVGLAVIGEHGLASSRPQATAVAVSGVAVARPIATAIAGVDPAALGIVFNANGSKKAKH